MSERVPARVGLLGGGVIGGGWAARFLLHGADVALYDPDPDAARRVGEVVANARRAFTRLVNAPLPPEGVLTLVATPEDAVDGVDHVQESAPERLELKRQLIARADAVAPRGVVIASSTSGLLPSRLQEGLVHPERLVVGHPFNPVYLLPLVEVCAGAARVEGVIDRVVTTYRSVGMRPLVLDAEVDGFVADRLLEALWREALWLVADGTATVSQIDDAIRFGAGLRWSAMGTFLTYRLAGGEAGMRHFMEQFGPTLQWPWTKLTDVPELTPELLDLLVAQSDEQVEGRSIRELEALRDDCLVAVMRGLQTVGFGAGEVVTEHEARLCRRLPATGVLMPVLHGRVVPGERHVTIEWDDGHDSAFHHLWLRDNCDCHECMHAQTRERLLDTFALDPDVAPTSLAMDQNALRIDWSDGHRASTYACAWLRKHCACAVCQYVRRPRHRHWGAALTAALPAIDYADVIADDGALAHFVESVWTDGVAFVRGTPTTEDAVRELATRVGHIRATNFGPDFHVEAMPEPNNVAYTAVELRPHTDLVNHSSPPGVQFLACFVADAPGGASTLVDGFFVADRLREESPEAFRLLCDVAIPYRFHDATHDLRQAAPVIVLDDDGTYREVRFNNALMAPLTLPVDQVGAVYDALRRFDAIARSPEAQVVVRLEPGDVMVFHNSRVLHGRTAFDPGGGARHLFGLYVDLDEWRSTMRVLESRRATT
ncbi:MAG: TauD/TfdA family dioxygenase [Actinomycetota bacterium]|nr:TauD/TfdA family dioxygenase [Actinomycetota bacterium]